MAYPEAWPHWHCFVLAEMVVWVNFDLVLVEVVVWVSLDLVLVEVVVRVNLDPHPYAFWSEFHSSASADWDQLSLLVVVAGEVAVFVAPAFFLADGAVLVKCPTEAGSVPVCPYVPQRACWRWACQACSTWTQEWVAW